MKIDKILTPDVNSQVDIAVFTVKVSAGFPSPAEGYMEGHLDLNKHLIKHPAATFFVRVSGDSMVGAGINDGDMLIVDRSLDAKDGDVVLAVVNSEFTVKRIKKHKDDTYLVPENENYEPIKVTEEMNSEIWGVVTNSIHKVR